MVTVTVVEPAASDTVDGLTERVTSGNRTAGVALTLSDSSPASVMSPLPVTARTWNVYSVSLVSSVTVWLVVLASLPAMAPQSPQFKPPSVLCRTSQPEMPLSPASAHLSVTSVSPGVAETVVGWAGWTVMANCSAFVTV